MALIVDTNVKYLHVSNGSYAITGKDHKSRDLCGKCSRSVCDIRMRRSHDVIGAVSEVTSCRSFMVPISFQSFDGIKDGCNTLRLGLAWFQKVNKGDQVGIVNAKTGELAGVAVVERVYAGYIDKMIKIHSAKNHLYINSDIAWEEAANRMKDKLPKIYGNHIYKNATHATAIYFKRVEFLDYQE